VSSLAPCTSWSILPSPALDICQGLTHPWQQVRNNRLALIGVMGPFLIFQYQTPCIFTWCFMVAVRTDIVHLPLQLSWLSKPKYLLFVHVFHMTVCTSYFSLWFCLYPPLVWLQTPPQFEHVWRVTLAFSLSYRNMGL